MRLLHSQDWYNSEILWLIDRDAVSNLELRVSEIDAVKYRNCNDLNGKAVFADSKQDTLSVVPQNE